MHITDIHLLKVCVNNVTDRHFTTRINLSGGVMVGMLASSGMDC